MELVATHVQPEGSLAVQALPPRVAACALARDLGLGRVFFRLLFAAPTGRGYMREYGRGELQNDAPFTHAALLKILAETPSELVVGARSVSVVWRVPVHAEVLALTAVIPASGMRARDAPAADRAEAALAVQMARAAHESANARSATIRAQLSAELAASARALTFAEAALEAQLSSGLSRRSVADIVSSLRSHARQLSQRAAEHEADLPRKSAERLRALARLEGWLARCESRAA